MSSTMVLTAEEALELLAYPDTATRTADPAGYAAQLDTICRAVAQHLVGHSGLDQSAP